MLLTLPDVPLRRSSFALADRWLLWARVEAYPDRLVMRGWSLTGRHHRKVFLTQIRSVEGEDGRLHLHLKTGEQVTLLVDQSARWARFLRAQCRVSRDRDAG